MVSKEGARDQGSELNCLLINYRGAEFDFIEACDAGCVRFVAICDLKGRTGNLLESFRLGRIESGVNANLGLAELVAEHP